MRSSFLLLVFCSVLGSVAQAQFQGNYAFDFVDVGFNARTAGAGGQGVSLRNHDVSQVGQNPALLNEKMAKVGSLNFVPLFADINGTSLHYAEKFNKIGMVAAHFNYLSYGKFKGFDDGGNPTSDFTASAGTFSLSHARTSGNFSLGGSLKFAGGGIANYGAFGAYVDLGGAFVHPKEDLVIGLAIRNLGGVIKNYVPGATTMMPLNIVAGISYKPAHAPIRLSITASQLNNPTFGGQNLPLAQAILRHFNVGAEFLLASGFHIRGGYNFQQRGELSTESRVGTAGLYVGAMLKIRMFEFGYTWASYAVRGGASFITLNVDMNSFFAKKQLLPTYQDTQSAQ